MSEIRPVRLPRRQTNVPTALRRLRQGLAALVSRPEPEVDRRLRSLLGDERQWALLARLSSFDRIHHLAVHDALVAGGCEDVDVLRAALLHDIGKADARGRVRLPHRVVKVLGTRLFPGQLDRLARKDGGWFRHGVWLAVRHADAGAALASEAGANARVCDLIRRHHDAEGAADDLGLAILRHVDEGVNA